jgi:hypothetical protein
MFWLYLFLEIIGMNIIIRIIHIKAPQILPGWIREEMDKIYGIDKP